MATVNLVQLDDLGLDFDIGVAVPNKITQKVDGTTIIRNATTGVLSAAASTPEIIPNAGPLTGAVPTGAVLGVDTINLELYYDNGGNWAIVPKVSVDLNTTYSDESGGDYGGGGVSAAAPAPDEGDTHIDFYDDVQAIFIAGAAGFPAAANITIPRDSTQFGDATLPATNATGDGGSSGLAARSTHRHAAQAPSADAGQLITTGSDDLHLVTAASLVSPAAGNQLTSDANGLLVPAPAPTTVALADEAAAGDISVTVNGVSSTLNIGAPVRELATFEIQDAFGNTLGYGFDTNA